MKLIPAGTFMMGSPESEKDQDPDEGPQHQVTLTKPFYMGKYEVTQAQWQAIMGNNPSYFSGKSNN
ncbi:MAG: SUMF1/EgtB/PvdO family nonheme iron enzyme [Candidatus Omnitrophota bacterium]